MHKTLFFSVVIPTLNEEKYLPLLLGDLAKQDIKPNSFEVIHVDSSSNDETTTVSKKFNTRLNLKIFSVKKRNVSFQRNKGTDQATAKWVVFMDADNRLPTSFLRNLKKQINNNKQIDIFSCWVRPKDNSPKDIVIAQATNLGMELYKSLGRFAVMGALIGVKREIANKIKFDSNQKVVEDAYFVETVIKKGHTYKLFRKPNYVYSLRRFEKEGTLKMLRIVAKLGIRFLQGKNFTESDYGYVMEGGAYYDQPAPSLFRNLFLFLKKAPVNQLRHAKETLKRINEELENL